MRTLRSIALLTLVLGLMSCDKNTLYNAYEDIEDGQWYLNNTPTFTFTVEDTTERYNLYYLIRNAQQYPYYNLYINRTMKGPDPKLQMTLLDEVYLSDETTGKPFGSGLGDLFDHKVLFMRNHRFAKPGEYTFTFTQSMRQNPLPFVMSVGLSVEKVVPDTQ